MSSPAPSTPTSARLPEAKTLAQQQAAVITKHKEHLQKLAEIEEEGKKIKDELESLASKREAYEGQLAKEMIGWLERPADTATLKAFAEVIITNVGDWEDGQVIDVPAWLQRARTASRSGNHWAALVLILQIQGRVCGERLKDRLGVVPNVDGLFEHTITSARKKKQETTEIMAETAVCLGCLGSLVLNDLVESLLGVQRDVA